MPSLSRSLEQALHRAIRLASERHHEYATLEHLLLALVDDADAAQVMRACNVDLDALSNALDQICRRGPGDAHHRRWRGRQAHDRIPARRSARGSARAEFRPRRGDRRQRAGRALLRAREPRRVLPPGTEHVAARCRELHEPRHRQAPGHEPVKAGARLRRGRREFRESGQTGHGRARSLLRQSERQGAQGPHRSA